MGIFEDLKNKDKNTKGYRVIRTARDLESINEAARDGFRPLVKKVEPSENIKSKYTIFQNKNTFEIEMIVDSRVSFRYEKDENYLKVIDKTFYYPYNFDSPFAAYLIPKDLKINEFVFLEDLIEDYIGFKWNQGVARRLKSCEARWNGKDFEILYTSQKRTTIMG